MCILENYSVECPECNVSTNHLAEAKETSLTLTETWQEELLLFQDNELLIKILSLSWPKPYNCKGCLFVENNLNNRLDRMKE